MNGTGSKLLKAGDFICADRRKPVFLGSRHEMRFPDDMDEWMKKSQTLEFGEPMLVLQSQDVGVMDTFYYVKVLTRLGVGVICVIAISPA